MFKILQSHGINVHFNYVSCVPVADLASEHHEFQFRNTTQNKQRVSHCQCICPLWSMIRDLIDICLPSIFDYHIHITHMIAMKTKWTRDHGFDYNDYIVLWSSVYAITLKNACDFGTKFKKIHIAFALNFFHFHLLPSNSPKYKVCDWKWIWWIGFCAPWRTYSNQKLWKYHSHFKHFVARGSASYSYKIKEHEFCLNNLLGRL